MTVQSRSPVTLLLVSGKALIRNECGATAFIATGELHHPHKDGSYGHDCERQDELDRLS